MHLRRHEAVRQGVLCSNRAHLPATYVHGMLPASPNTTAPTCTRKQMLNAHAKFWCSPKAERYMQSQRCWSSVATRLVMPIRPPNHSLSGTYYACPHLHTHGHFHMILKPPLLSPPITEGRSFKVAGVCPAISVTGHSVSRHGLKR